MHALKQKKITCVVTDITASEKDESNGRVVLHMACGATRSHHPTKANRITDGPVTCMDCMSLGRKPWDPSIHLVRIAEHYINTLCKRKAPHITVSSLGGHNWRRRHVVGRVLSVLGYLGPRVDDQIYQMKPASLDFINEEKPTLTALVTGEGELGSQERGVPWGNLTTAHKKYIFLHPIAYTFHFSTGYGRPPKKMDGGPDALKLAAEGYGHYVRVEDPEYVAAYTQSCYTIKLRALRKARFVDVLTEKGLRPAGETSVYFTLNEHLSDPIGAQVQQELDDAQRDALLWKQRVEFLEQLNANVAQQGGWDAFEAEYMAWISTLAED